VISLCENSPNFGQFFENYKSSPIFCYFKLRLCINFDKQWAGLHFGRLFNKLIWSLRSARKVSIRTLRLAPVSEFCEKRTRSRLKTLELKCAFKHALPCSTGGPGLSLSPTFYYTRPKAPSPRVGHSPKANFLIYEVKPEPE
jgi:hypothetical protein